MPEGPTHDLLAEFLIGVEMLAGAPFSKERLELYTKPEYEQYYQVRARTENLVSIHLTQAGVKYLEDYRADPFNPKEI